jgi:hypothetical protein
VGDGLIGVKLGLWYYLANSNTDIVDFRTLFFTLSRNFPGISYIISLKDPWFLCESTVAGLVSQNIN